MIPKTIHYCWFGNGPKNEEILGCLQSWKKYAPEFEIKEWNELAFPVEKYPYASRVYNEKKWAFVADYARLKILEEQGGFYLDTDMLLVAPLSSLVDKSCVAGEESPGMLNASILGAEPLHPFIQACLAYYDTHPHETETIPRIMTRIYNDQFKGAPNVSIYPPKTFYPFDIEHIKQYHGQNLGPDTIGIHLWHYSWGHPLNKFFKKIGIYRLGKKIVEILGIKQVLKKLFGFI
jgi:hypothetical protein